MRKDAEDLIGSVDAERLAANYEGPMYDLFLAKCPNHLKPWGEKEILDIDKLAKDVGLSRQNVYAWFHKNRLPPNRVKKILALEGAVFDLQDLLPFVIEE